MRRTCRDRSGFPLWPLAVNDIARFPDWPGGRSSLIVLLSDRGPVLAIRLGSDVSNLYQFFYVPLPLETSLP